MIFKKIIKKIKRIIKNTGNLMVKISIVVIAFCIFFAGASIIWISTLKIPSLESFEQRKVTESTKIYDRTGEILLFDVFQNIKRTIVPFDEISRNIKNATIAIEDKEFYEHNGIKPKAFLRAVLVNLRTLDFTQGGSTITQQVVKNSLLTSEKRISRKIKEWVLAVKLEKVISKDEILNLYLNEIPYGGSLYGVEEASNAFFNKKSSEVTIAEAAYLAALHKAPSFYSPYGQNVDKLEERKNLVLSEMLQNNFINEEEYEEAVSEKVFFRPRSELGIKAPHFVMYVRDYLEKMYGKDVLEEGGLKVITTIDYELQMKAEEMAKKHALSNEKSFNAENIALTVIDPKSGDILVMVGSRDYFDEEIDGNYNVTTAARQPGSAFKPFAYAEAFNKGYTPETIIFDLKTQFSTSCGPNNLSNESPCYSPSNYDNIFRGPITMRNALAQSINVPAVKTLYLAGLNDTLTLARNMGVESLKNAGVYGLTLVLGGGEVSLLEMTSAYGVFANNGLKNSHRAILEIKDKNGNVIEKAKTRAIRVLPEQTALKISDILSDNEARTPAYGINSPLYFGEERDVAVKTGTTNDYKDAWIIGYAPNIVVGAWAGNNDSTSMEKLVAGYIITPFWREFMDEILKNLPVESFMDYERESIYNLKPVMRGIWTGGYSDFIDSTTEETNQSNFSQNVDERISGGVHTILYWVDRRNPRGAMPINPASDPQFILWETPVRNWANIQGI